MEGVTLTNSSAKDRPATDYYPTPTNVTEALLDYLKLSTSREII